MALSTILIVTFLLGTINYAFAVETTKEDNNKERYIVSISKHENKEKNKAIYDADVQKNE